MFVCFGCVFCPNKYGYLCQFLITYFGSCYKASVSDMSCVGAGKLRMKGFFIGRSNLVLHTYTVRQVKNESEFDNRISALVGSTRPSLERLRREE